MTEASVGFYITQDAMPHLYPISFLFSFWPLQLSKVMSVVSVYRRAKQAHSFSAGNIKYLLRHGSSAIQVSVVGHPLFPCLHSVFALDHSLINNQGYLIGQTDAESNLQD